VTRLDRKSDAQANAEALGRDLRIHERSATYAAEHASSWQVRFDRPTHEPRTLRELVRALRTAYAEEVPSRLHNRDTDEGGHPAWTPEFTRYLAGADAATDRGDGGTTEVYLTPFRACMAGMMRSSDEATRKRAAIVGHVTITGLGPAEGAMLEGVPEWDAKASAHRALQLYWRRLSGVRLDLRPVDTGTSAA